MNTRVHATRPVRRVWLVAFCAVALLGAVAALVMQPIARAEEDETPLQKHMEAINTSYKNLRRAARSGTFDSDTMAMVLDMESHVLITKSLEPAIFKKVPAAKQKQMSIEYRKIQIKLLDQLMAIEIALMEGKTEEVAAGVNNLALIKKEGHDKFVEE